MYMCYINNLLSIFCFRVAAIRRSGVRVGQICFCCNIMRKLFSLQQMKQQHSNKRLVFTYRFISIINVIRIWARQHCLRPQHKYQEFSNKFCQFSLNPKYSVNHPIEASQIACYFKSLRRRLVITHPRNRIYLVKLEVVTGNMICRQQLPQETQIKGQVPIILFLFKGPRKGSAQ